MEDERFAHVTTDPKFRRIPKGERKVKIDKRFQSMFEDKRFKVKYTTDKRGRPVNHSTTEDLKRYYELPEDSSSDSEEEDDTASGKYIKAPTVDEPETESNELKVKHKSDKQISDSVRNKLKDLNVDYARGEGYLCSGSSSDDESEEEISDEDEVEHKWGELDADAETTEEATCRLAVCNTDWDRIRAVDLMVLFSSFLPQNSYIKSVVIYPSEFGLQRMKEEEVNGPRELVENKLQLEDETNEDETEEGAKYHMEKLREYQLNRLKYYYAVITCDSVNTANKIYSECDGLEYESSATKVDLRFIPDDMTFDAQPKDVCDKLPNLAKYQPRFFTTTALQQAKVNLTWDETDPERIEVTQKLSAGKVDDISEADLQAYLASSSEEEEEEIEVAENQSVDSDLDDNPINKYRALLSQIESKEKEKEKGDIQMEVSWGIDLKEKTEELVKKRLSEKENKTPFQEYLDKRKEKRKQKQEHKKLKANSDESDVPSDIDLNDSYFAEEFDKPEFKQKKKQNKEDHKGDEEEQKQAELELLLSDEDDSKKHFSLKRILEQESDSKSKKRRRKKNEVKASEDNFEIKVNDERFSALYTSHHFNIDPTDPHFKKTKAMSKLLDEKLKRRNAEDAPPSINRDNRKGAELSALVKSVKRKAQNYDNKKK